MTTLEVFTTAACAVPHQADVVGGPEDCRFTTDLQWLADQGVEVRRVTLSEEPGRFVAHDAVRFLTTILGTDVLPVVLVDGLIRSHGRYPGRDELGTWASLTVAPSLDPLPQASADGLDEAVLEELTEELEHTGVQASTAAEPFGAEPFAAAPVAATQPSTAAEAVADPGRQAPVERPTAADGEARPARPAAHRRLVRPGARPGGGHAGRGRAAGAA